MTDVPRRVQDIFESVVDLPAADRDAYVEQSCGDDEQLKQRVLTLLKYADDDEDDDVASLAPRADDLVGTTIDRYTLRALIGEGGFGTVYLADQSEPVRRRVAIKIIKLGMDTKSVIARFQAERQALALMDHPGVARIFDGGTTPQGRPYFVMEYVQGVPITEFCDKHRLAISERIKLFREVCSAIQHAHTKGVIHRDIKPNNILVTYEDDQLVIKVIDFGIAKALDQRLTEQTLFTESGQLIGTPEYMSPEQAEMSALNIDTRSDVYALGVLLYELLSGQLPFDPQSLRAAGLGEIQRIIREDEPSRPSTRCSSLITASHEDSRVIALARQLDPKVLPRRLRGDLDWIVMKCLEKERSRRYETASSLGADLGRYLDNEPVEAGPPSAVYRFKKFARRKAGLLAAVSILAAVLVAGIAVSTYFAVIASQEKKEAVSQRDQAEQERVRTDVQRNRAEQESARANAQRDQAEQERARTDVQRNRAEKESARANAQRDQAEQERARAEAQRDQAEQERARANAQRDQAEQERARAEAVKGFLENMLLSVSPEISGGMDKQLMKLILSNAAADIGQRLADQPLVRADIQSTIGTTYRGLGLLDKADPPLQEALSIRRRVLGDEHPDTLDSINNMGLLLSDQGKYGEAEVYYRKALEARRRVLGDEHPHTLNSINNMGVLLSSQGKYDEAEVYYHEALEANRRVLGDEHPSTLTSINNMGVLLSDQGKYDEAEPYYRTALKAQRRVLGDEHPDTLTSINKMGILLSDQGKYDEAEPYFREALETMRRVLGDEHPDTLASTSNMGLLLSDQGKYDEAEPYLREALETSRRVLGDDHPDTLLIIESLAELYEAWGKPDEARKYRDQMPIPAPADASSEGGGKQPE